MTAATKTIIVSQSLILAPSQEGQKVARAAPPANDARMPDLVDKVLALICKQNPALAADAKQLEGMEATLREHFGGAEQYVRKRRPSEQTAQAILAQFNGQNSRTVARELGVSRATVYRKLKQPKRPPA